MDSNDYLQLVADLGSGYSDICPMDEGGMGSIYRAHKDSLDVEVVIKKIKKKFSGRLNERAEANILKLLKHKYLPRIYDVIESRDGYIYTIMDLISGENLQHYITNRGSVDQKKAYRWACQLCEVVEYLHAQTPPILHCDIKPSNIIITPEEDICLIDFNTSLVFSDGVLAIGATPGYAAPEQYTKLIPRTVGAEDATIPAYTGTSSRTASRTSGASSSLTAAQTVSAGNYGTISPRTDIYGIGATLYFALTGTRPNRSLEPVKPITAYKLKLSRSFQNIILRAMQKNPKDRFGSAKEMLRALRDIHMMDTRYKNIVRLQWVTLLCALSCAAVGAGLTVWGANLIHQENDAEYAYNVLRGQTAGEATQFDEAEKYLDAAIAIYDNRLEAYTAKALLLYRQGEYARCIDEIKTIFSRPLVCNDQQEWANVCYIAANSYYELADYENAVQWYQRAIEYSPSIEAYYRDCAIALAQAGKQTEVRQMLEQMRGLFPDAEASPSYQIVCAEINMSAGNNEEALRQLQEIIAQSSDEQLLSRAYVMAAQVCKKIGDTSLDQEIALLEDGVSRLSGSYRNVVGSYLGIAYASKAERSEDSAYAQKALETFEMLRENGLKTLSVRLNIAVLQQQLKQYDNAAKTLEELTEDYPNEYSVYKRFAFLYAEIESQQRQGYAKTKAYYELAEQYYQLARAAGTEDSEMTQLEEIVRTLK